MRIAALVALLLGSTTPLQAADSVVEHIPLGKSGQLLLTAEVRFSPEDAEVDENSGVFTVVFKAASPDGKSTDVVSVVGHGRRKPMTVTAADFVRIGRKQLFIAVAKGAVINQLLDWDGSQVRTLYEESDGRCSAHPVQRGKAWVIQEDWPRRQFEDLENPGHGVDIGGNVIRRVLRWDGWMFVPEAPSNSQIRR